MFKKTVLTTILATSTFAVMTAHAALPSGLYVSGQAGYADTNLKSRVPSGFGLSLTNDGLAGRLAMGYKLAPNLALELGYLQLSSTTTHYPRNTYSSKQHAIDLVAKGILPITSNVNVYGKLGAAYLTTQLERTTVAPSPVTVDLNDSLGIDKHQWAPEITVGMGYDITTNVSVDTSLTHIQTIGNHRPGNIDFLAVGVAYNFG